MITIDKLDKSKLLQALQTFDSNGYHAKRGDWSIVDGGYDIEFAINYKNQQVVSCVDGVLENDGIDDSDFNTIRDIVISVYPDVS